MPEWPAQKKTDLNESRNQNVVERLATPEELAEFGSIAPNPVIEAQILALLEAQMNESAPGEQAAGLAVGLPAGTLVAAKIVGAEPTPHVLVISPSKSDTIALASSSQASTSSLQLDFAEPGISASEMAPSLTGSELPTDTTASELPPKESNFEPEFDTAGAKPDTKASSPSGVLEFALILDQHRLWVESVGAQGECGDLSGLDLDGADLTAVNLQGAQLNKTNFRGADLSMANLRGASMVEADLRETNLLGAEFSGANLMGANLYGAQGLWAGRLGGTNLFDATLPEAVAAHDGGKTIAQSTLSARRFYLLVMVLCAGACALVALTTDVRLLLDQSAVPSSRIPNLLPLQGFYLGAPLLLTVLYLRLQYLLLRLWGSIGALPAVFPDGQTPQKDGSWYLMGPIRPHLRWSRDPRSPLALAESVMARILAYWAVPTALFVFWLRYLVLQDYRGTLLQVAMFTLVMAAACGLPRIVARVLRPGDWAEETTSNFMRDVLSALRIPLATGFVMFLLSLGVIHGLPADQTLRPDVGRGDPRRWAATAFQSVGFRPYADITEESVSDSPAKDFAKESSPGDAPGPRMNEMNLRYARGYRAAFANARMWRANLEGASLSEADFRGANLREGVLRSAKLDRLQAAKANLVSADAEWANFSGADFRSADMSFANLEGATLTTANLTRATLYSVILHRANMLRVDLSHADVRDAKMEDALLSLAILEQTDLSSARLHGANLTGAQAKGTIFLEADLSGADLRGADLTGAILRQAKLDGANLDGTDLRGALGLDAAQVCSAQNWRGAQLDADIQQAVAQRCGVSQQASPQQ
jgi:uncharacterized protein YjbI with pentapeptide repeats